MDQPVNFFNDRPIYVQIAERLCDEITAGRYPDDGRVPSVREYSALLEVNVNTTVKAYDQLLQSGIVYQKRGLGYFVTPGAREKILDERRSDFIENQIPTFVQRMKALGISPEQVSQIYNQAQ